MNPHSARWTIALGSAILGLVILLLLQIRSEKGLRVPGIRGPAVGCKVAVNRAVCLQQLSDTCLEYLHVIALQPCDSMRDDVSDMFEFVRRYVDTVQLGRPVSIVELRCVDNVDTNMQRDRIAQSGIPFLRVYVDPRTETWQYPVFDKVVTWINDSVELEFPVGRFSIDGGRNDADANR